MKKKETAEEFVRRMLTGLTAKTLPDYPNSTFYVNDKDELILEIEKDIAWCRWTGFWSVLQGEYMLKYDEIQLLIGRILEQALKVKGVIVRHDTFCSFPPLEQALKVKGVIVLRLGYESCSTLEQALKVKGVTVKPKKSKSVNKKLVNDIKKEIVKNKQLIKKVKEVKRKIEIDSKRIKKFLAQTTGANYQFLSAMMDVRNGINNIITNYKLSKEEVCERFGVSKRKYNDFIHGNYEYDLKIMAVINDTFCEYESKKLGENAPFQTPKTEGK